MSRTPTVVCLMILSALAGCEERDLRGRFVASADGGTYLVIEHDNGGHCGPILVDGRRWTHPIDSRGAIAPGRHTIECGTSIELEIKAGTTFHFDYWGP